MKLLSIHSIFSADEGGEREVMSVINWYYKKHFAYLSFELPHIFLRRFLNSHFTDGSDNSEQVEVTCSGLSKIVLSLLKTITLTYLIANQPFLIPLSFWS